MAGKTPGKLNNIWEQNIPESAKPLTGNKAKISHFEQAAQDAAPKEVVKKKTWSPTGNSGGGHTGHDGKFRGKTKIGDGPPPAKSITDLP